MKRIVASIGVAALGAACVQSANAQGDGAKPWSASVALRGFYDDNINTSPTDKVDSFGFAVSPTLGYVLKADQTTASFAYTYGFLYYDEKPAGNTGHDDQTHTIAASLEHVFNERTTISISDSFVIGQEPDQLRAGAADATFQRISGQNVRNFAQLTLNHELTRTFGLEVGYANSLYNYEDDTYAVQSVLGFPVAVNPVSNSGVLDRIENIAHIDARWKLQPTTGGLVGYAFSWDHYTADQPIGVVNLGNPNNISENMLVNSEDRDSRSSYIYGGVEHDFRSDLHAALRVGARFTDYFNSPTDESSTSPYVLASLTYNYAKDGRVQVGVSHDLSATDAFSTQGSSITEDSSVTVFYASVSHRILPLLTGSLMGQFQNSGLNGGEFDGGDEQYYILNASLAYEITRHIFATLSYNYDRLESSIAGRGFDRNRVFLGATFTY